jgi:hypothetical protein
MAMKRPLTFGSRLMAVKQQANVNRERARRQPWAESAEARKTLHQARTTEHAQGWQRFARPIV